MNETIQLTDGQKKIISLILDECPPLTSLIVTIGPEACSHDPENLIGRCKLVPSVIAEKIMDGVLADYP
jgi:hypothetical protein